MDTNTLLARTSFPVVHPPDPGAPSRTGTHEPATSIDGHAGREADRAALDRAVMDRSALMRLLNDVSARGWAAAEPQLEVVVAQARTQGVSEVAVSTMLDGSLHEVMRTRAFALVVGAVMRVPASS